MPLTSLFFSRAEIINLQKATSYYWYIFAYNLIWMCLKKYVFCTFWICFKQFILSFQVRESTCQIQENTMLLKYSPITWLHPPINQHINPPNLNTLLPSLQDHYCLICCCNTYLTKCCPAFWKDLLWGHTLIEEIYVTESNGTGPLACLCLSSVW